MPCTRQLFHEITDSQELKQIISQCRQLYAVGDKKGYDARKRSLPMFIFQADHFLPNRGAKGTLQEGAWRLQTAAVLNGLVMHDFDKLSQRGTTPVKVFHGIPDHWFDDKTCRTPILLAAVTPSGDGLRLVTVADPERGLLAEQQQWVATSLGLEGDEAVKNADRTSFAVDSDSILYLNEKIFDYDNKAYDEKYGRFYRGTGSAGTHQNGAGSADPRVQGSGLDVDAAVAPGGPAAECNEQGDLTYEGVSMQKIAEAYTAKYGDPAVGKRHAYLLRLATRLRPLVERNEEKLRRAVRLFGFVRDWEQSEGGAATREVERILADACQLKGGYRPGKAMESILGGLGIHSDDAEPADDADGEYGEAGKQFWRRLEPYVEGPYLPAVSMTSDENKVGAVFAAGAMFCTLMTRCWYTHYDGNLQRMNPQVYIIGDPASGKSFANLLDQCIMAAMRYADQPARDAEERYKNEQQERSTSSKAQKGDALKRPEGMIRYIPSRTSNAVFYRRCVNAKEVIGGEVMPLHLYTFDSELDSSITAQSGGSWIGKHDLELKAFHNEGSGVDYANNDSVNRLIPIYWNTVVTGTPLSLAKKITLRNINDGLCSRIAVFRMASQKYQMIGRGSMVRNHERELALKEWGYYFESLKGELKIDRLVDHVYTLCKQCAQECEENRDDVRDFLRKRAVFYATWLVIPQIVGRLRGKKKQNGEPLTLQDVKVTDNDLRMASVIFDAVLYYQDHLFGQMLQDSWDNAKREFQPRKRNSRYAQAYEQLPSPFSVSDVERVLGVTNNAAAQHCKRWLQSGYIDRQKQGTYVKLITSIQI